VYGARAAELSGAREILEGTTMAESNALRDTVRDDIGRELSQLAREDRDPEIRRAARRATERLGDRR
jgi:hypothetical protein